MFDCPMHDSESKRQWQRRGRDLTVEERIQQLTDNPLHAVKFHLAKLHSVHKRLFNGKQQVLGGPCQEAVKANEAQRHGTISIGFNGMDSLLHITCLITPKTVCLIFYCRGASYTHSSCNRQPFGVEK